MMKVPQFMPFIGEEEYRAIKDCFDANWITEGPKAKEFNEKLKGLLGVKFGVFAPNGTLALYLALKALGIKEGDEVIVPDCTFIASANSVEMLGATPVFVDVNRDNFQIDVNQCKRVLSKRTKAIMPVHLYGMVANMNAVTSFAQEYGLMIVEDAAQALGIRYNGKYAGTFGQVSCFSFFADKTLTTGEGGYVVTNDENIYEYLLYIRNQGRLDRGTFIHPMNGYNFRMTDIQMAIGLVQLSKMPLIAENKIKIYSWYKMRLSDVKQVQFTSIEPGSEFIPFRVTLIADRAPELMKFLSENGVEPRTFFYPLHKQPCFQYLKHNEDYWRRLDDRNFPNAIYGYEHGVCLPSFAALKEEQVSYVCDKIKEFYHVL